MTEKIAEHDMEAIREKAEVIAEATGRSVEAIIEDLLDDGIVNLSNEEKKDKDLVEQLKEAAELITTVQAISQEVSENTVLNGGENSTEVKVETTLEGDIVDRAIESLQNKADNIKKLLITLTPVFILLTGGSMEAFGIINLLGDDGDDQDDDYYYDEVWGCTAWDAENYDPDATHDDGSCWWDDNNGGGGGPPHQNCDWIWDDNSYTNDEEPDTLYVLASFSSPQCPHEMQGDFSIALMKDGQVYSTEDDYGMIFYENQDLGHQFIDLEAGTYLLSFHYHNYEPNSDWNWDSPRTYVIEEPMECSASLQNQQGYLVQDDAEQDAITLSVDIAIPSEIGNACDSEQFELTWRLYSNSQVQYEEHTWEDGWISDNDRADYVSYTWNDIAVDTYESRIILKLNDEVIDEKWLAYGITVEAQAVYGCTDSEATNYDSSANEDDGSCEYPPTEPCDVEIQNHYRGHVVDDAEQDAILVAFRVVPSNCEGKMVEIDIELFQNGYDANYSHWLEVNGDNQYTDVSHAFDGVAVGDSWTPTIIASLDDEVLEQVWFWGIDVEEQEPENCEINLFDIALQTNNTTATISFDLDCGYDTNDLEGYNVSVQFLIYHVNETNNGANGTGPLEWTTQLYYIEGYADDVRTLILNNFTVENTTHYDFYWYAIWENADGDQQFIERKWLNRELSP